MSTLTERLEALSPEKRRLLELRLKERDRTTVDAGKSIPTRPMDGEPIPLSFAQQRLWFLERFQPGTSRYNIPIVMHLIGDLDLPVLEAGLNEIVRRHEALRTRFPSVDDKPIQLIQESAALTVTQVDLRTVNQLGLHQKLTTNEALRPFDLETGPLLRALLLRQQDRDQVLVLTMHHIVSDGWSMDVFYRELMALYGAYRAGRPSPLQALPIQYADFAHWQLQRMGAERASRQLVYWEEQLAGAQPILELPTDRPRSASQLPLGGVRFDLWPTGLVEGLSSLGREADSTLFMTLMAAFQALLCRWSGQSDISTGTPIAGRNEPETEALIGFFVNTLVIRTDLSGDPTFGQLLSRVRKVALGAFAHQDLPFEQVVEALQPERSLSHTPLFQVLFSFQNVPSRRLELPGLEVALSDVHSEIAKFDLSLAMLQKEDGLSVEIEYSAGLFDASTIRRLSEHLRSFLEQALEDPHRKIGDIGLLSLGERQQVLVEWADTASELRSGITLSSLLSAQAQRTPTSAAVVFGETELTYAELERRTNQLGYFLRSLGVGPESRVGVFMERSAEMVVALAGVLKSGGAYVPFDLNYPEDRLSFMLDDADVEVLLTEEGLLERLPGSGVEVLCLDRDSEQIEQSPGDSLAPLASPENLAYVIYTSGSTGVPKGVAITHASAVAMLAWASREFPASTLSGVLASTSICFDLSIFELYLPLSEGGRVIVADSLLELPELPARNDVTLINTVPSALSGLLALDGMPPSVRVVNVAGEALERKLVDEAYAQLGVAAVYNLYGPSEGTTYSTFARLPVESREAPSIGRGIGNTRIYLFDRAMLPVPRGVIGELYVGGAGVTRGYLGRTDLTAERFVPDPYGYDERLYRTGDLARYQADGSLDFLGRVDHQVKIRGFRIELGEIEANLAEHPAVRQSVVLAREDDGQKRLVAYVVSEWDPVPGPDQLRGFLQEQLPEYMVPSLFVFLDALPLNPNGKIDRKALPVPPDSARMPGQATAPRSPAEEVLFGIWSDLLSATSFGVNDDFFSLGGHSLLATQVVSRVRDAFGVDLSLQTLFELPTVAGLARKAEEFLSSDVGSSVPPLIKVSSRENLPLSFSQQGLWFLDRMKPGSASYNVPHAFRLTGHLKVSALEASLNEIVHRHEALRTRFSAQEGKPVLIIREQERLPLPCVDLRARCHQDTALELVNEEMERPFDLEVGPVIRVLMLRVQDDEHILVVTMHHIITDAWSLGVFLTELMSLYDANSAGQPSPLPALAIQFADFAHWQRHEVIVEKQERQLEFWQERLAGAPPLLELPSDRPRPAVMSRGGAGYKERWAFGPLEALRSQSRGADATLFMALLAAFQTLMSRYSGQEDICTGTAIANRNRSETEALIGFFVNTLAIRTDLSGNPTFEELLHRVREGALGDFAHQDVSFERVVEAVQPKRSESYTPLFQVGFGLQTSPIPDLEFAGLEVTPFTELEVKIAKFDIGMALSEDEDGFGVAVEYSTDLFDLSTISRLVGHLRSMVDEVVANPEQRIYEIDFLSRSEKLQLLGEFNDTGAEYPRDASLSALFAAQAARQPTAPVMKFGSETMSYGELDQKANQVAHYLRRHGVGEEALVGLFVERSAAMVVAMLGILKAGGAYVPLDQSYPAERQQFMLADAGINVLLTQASLIERLPDFSGDVVCLDHAEVVSQSTAPPHSRATSANLAYVIYTSGSTGVPKGAAVGQRAVARLVLGSNYVRLGPTDRVGQASNSSFDAATFEIWGALLNGAMLVGLEREVLLEPALLVERLRHEKISTLFLTTALFNQVIREVPDAFAEVGTVLFGGEAVDPRWVQRALAQGAPERLLHVYGPTESTTFATWHHVQQVADDAGTIAIGAPLANTTAFVLDQRLRPGPTGFVGELLLGGEGLARGYLKRPALTAERWVPSPFGDGERLYRTGDLVLQRRDGAIEFVGRRDHQVKIRGFRIELGEIEAKLATHPEIAECVVVARAGDGMDADQKLVAYVCPRQEPGLDTGVLRSYLEEQLPDYMVPSTFVVLESLPLTPNGKLDRKALPAPQEVQAQSVVEEEAVAWTETEELLAEMWSELLGVENVGPEDDFFELGGHSLLATQLVSRIRERFSIDLPVQAVFETTNVVELAEEVDNVRSELGDSLPPLVPVTSRDELPLSYAQQQLWFLDRLEPASSTYNLPIALNLAGSLDIRALEASLNEIVRRHEALRTVFAASDGKPVSIVRDPQPQPLPVVHLDSSDLEQTALEAVSEEMRKPFDLETGPLFRCLLIETRADEHILVLTMHHIISDGWSLGVLFEDLMALYSAFRAGRPSPLPELTIQFADFAHWQRQLAEAGQWDEQLSYWQEQLAGAPSFLDLPTDRPRKGLISHRAANHNGVWPGQLVESLKALGRDTDATLFMTLLATLQVLLSRYSGQTDLNTGTAIANRNQAETEGVVGFFVNTLVMRTDLSGTPTFTELLGRVRRVALDAFAHQDISFEQLVEVLQPERSLSHTPLFQVMFALQNVPLRQLELEELEVGPLEDISTETAKFDLTLAMLEEDHGLRLGVEYKVELFDASTIHRLLSHLRSLLEQVASNPEQKIGDIDFLGVGEKRQMLGEWTDSDRSFPCSATVGDLFSAQAQLTPSAPAVTFGEIEMSYGELEQRSNQLAHHLCSLGVGSESRVGLFVERSAEMVVALLGILKSGGAYVPLDFNYPAERLSFMLADAGVEVLLAQEHLAESWPASDGLQVVCLDRDAGHIATFPTVRLDSVAHAESLAYVIYTSGSTGMPKGVGVPHRAVVRLVKETNYLDFGPDEVVLQLAPVSFDASTLELWGSLLNGARLVVYPPQAPSLAELGEALSTHGVTTLWLTAPLFHQMVDAQLEDLVGVRQLLAGGDVLSVPHMKKALAGGAQRLINGYGPTENTTFTCCHELRPADVESASIPIGRPISNTRVVVLDGEMSPVPVGVPGELYIGGSGLARGYLDQAGLTASRFVADPFGDGERLYRTGDLVRYQPTGTLEFLGRQDHQVKVRGFRIELGEIETVLVDHPEVSECAVLAWADESAGGQQSLVAYFCPRHEPGPESELLRKHLRERLPDHMVPSLFVAVSEMPLSPNGKVDREALPAPRVETVEGEAPRNPAEEVLVGIWSDLLNVAAVGVHDNFFELGGHSLLATQVISRVRDAFGVDLPLQALFEAPTVAGLAQKTEDALRLDDGQSAPPLVAAKSREDLPLSFSQQRLWFLDRIAPGSFSYNVPMAFRLTGSLNLPALEAGLNEIVRRHEVLRTRFSANAGKPVLTISPQQRLPVPVVDLEARSSTETVLRLVRSEMQRSFDLELGPVIRALLLRIRGDEHVLLVTMHHIITDGWSLGVFFTELMSLYDAFSAGQASPLPELTLQFADFASWQRQEFFAERQERQLAYWQERLSGAPPLLELPTDRPRPAVMSHRGAGYEARWPLESKEALSALSRESDATLFITLLTAFQVLMARYSGQLDISTGTAVANRNRSETESLIGFFVNTLVIRSDLAGSPSFEDLLRRVREVSLGAFAHQDVSFERVVEVVQPERSESYTPLFQVGFGLQTAPIPKLELEDLEVEPFSEAEATIARFDIGMAMSEDENGFGIGVEYSTDLFDHSTIGRMLGHLRALIDRAVADPKERIGDIDFLGDSEKRQLLTELNDTGTQYPREASLGDLFAEHAMRQPTAPAVVFGSETLSYGELDQKSNEVAHYLQSHGVQEETLVGLIVERSPEMVVAMLSILKAGGAYVPLDQSYPAERLHFMLEDAGIEVLLTQSRLVDGLPDFEGRVLCLDDAQVASQPKTLPRHHATGANLAYIIYTSGSTGTPKGAAVVQRSVARLVLASSYIHLGPTDRVGQASNSSFDAATFEIWGALLNGATLVGIPQQVLLEPGELVKRLRQEEISALFLTTALFNQVVREIPDAFTTVGTVLFGGEAVDPRWVRRVLDGGAPTRLLHVYGPTESTTFATSYPVRQVPENAATIAIGAPIANTTAFVLDQQLRPGPVGFVGELLLGGDGLARGYLKRSALTAERWVPSPFGDGERLYKTGDSVLQRADGTIEFVGRRDHQVKIRGFRIELGEIETRLSTHPDVRECVVVARTEDSTDGTSRLVAYVCSHQDPAPDLGALRGHLEEQLPDYMVPRVFVVLESLPLNPNGKLDRAALPAPQDVEEQAAVDVPTDWTETEEVLAGLWSELLGVETVGPEDDFFELGGHSLLATQLVSRIREKFEVDLPVQAVFETTNVGELAQEVDAVRSEAEERIPPMVPITPRDEFPLSFSQRQLWFLDRLAPGKSTYNLPIALRFKGSLDTQALRASLDLIVRRHESLRTRFSTREGKPVAIVSGPEEHQLSLVQRDSLDQHERALELVKEEMARPFDLETGPLFRALLVRTHVEEHLLVLTMHHIISDGWSLGVLFEDLMTVYPVFCSGQPASLPDLQIQYGDFAHWQGQRAADGQWDDQLDYWKQQLAGAPGILELPTDRPRPPVLTHRAGGYIGAWSPEFLESLMSLSRKADATLFMTLLAMFQVVLSRYSGQLDISTGTPIANRHQAETESIVGFFINTLVIRTDLSGGPTFRELLERVRAVTLGAFAHPDLSFEQLVEALQPERSLSHTPLFQVMFGLQNVPVRQIDLAGLEVEPLEDVGTEIAKFDISLAMLEDDGLRFGIEYNADLFDASTIRRLMAQLGALMERVVSDPDRRVGDVDFLGHGEKQQLLNEWNSNSTDFPRDDSLQKLFSVQVARQPKAAALVFEQETVNYGELDRRANQLAHRLRHLGVSSETLVGLFLEPSIEMLVGMLGILKAGGAYVPLDLTYPTERLLFMLADTDIRILLSKDSHLDRLPDYGGEIVCLGAAELLDEPSSEVAEEVGASQLAYVIYTSGSTGLPKGVAVTQRAVVRLVKSTDYVTLEPSQRMAMVSNSSFDAATFEIWGALLNGGCLVDMPREVLLSPSALAAKIREKEISHMFLTTALFNQVAREEPEAFSTLKTVLFGGEAVDPGWVHRVLREGAPERLLHVYGPTENTTFSTWYEVENVLEDAATISIGAPIANSTAYVLNQQLQPAPRGAHGELCLGGEGLARGYLRRPGLTAERWVPSPFGDGERLYRTGDIVRYRRQGDIEFMGRRDHQVKIRGFRIELGEIEAVLNAHPAVEGSVVLARKDDDHQRLVAYLTPHSEAPLDSDLLRDFAREKLPEFMVPSVFVFLPDLPLTPNGKVDRAALPAPQIEQQDSVKSVVPRSPAEDVMVGIWSDLLNVESLGVDDDFFELGGHSLLATQLISRVRDAFGVELPLQTLFETPTVAGLVRKAEESLRESDGQGVPRLEAVASRENLPLSFSQQRLWFIDRLTPGSSTYNVPIALRLSGTLNVRALEASLNHIVRRHEALRCHFSTKQGKPVLIVQDNLELPMPLVDLAIAASQASALAVAGDEMARPFDLETGPLVRTMLIRTQPDEHILLVTMHHIISDGWSVGVLFNELMTLYSAYHSGQPSPLPELAIQFADFAVWQRHPDLAESWKKQLAYWQERLAGAPPILELPTDRPRPPQMTHRAAGHQGFWPLETMQSIQAFSRDSDVTVFMTLMSAFQVLLSRYSGQVDVSTGTPIANRNRSETEGLIGFFVNTLVIRTDLSGAPTFEALLQRVRRNALEAFAHQDVPFEQVVEALQPARTMSHTPLFQVMFALQNIPISSVDLPGLVVTPLEGVETEVAKFDLTLGMAEDNDGLLMSVEYNVDLFDASTVHRLLAHLRSLVEQVVSNPAQKVSEVDFLGENEKRQLLGEWTDSGSSFPSSATLGDLFSAQAELTPSAPAVTFDGSDMSYGELEQRSNQLAHYLCSLGVSTESRVGLLVERSAEMVVALLGILKSGGAYVPLDFNYPAKRLSFMLADAGVEVLLAQEHLAENWPASDGQQIVCLDRDAGRIATCPTGRLDSLAHAESLAYVIYTSGSTGIPKGVGVPHRAVVRLVKETNYLDFGPDEVVLQLAPISFDASTLELWGSLLNGARLVVYPPQTPSLAELGEALSTHGVTTLWLTAPLFHQMVDSQLKELVGVRQLLAGGDVLSVPHMKKALAGGAQRLINGYGPTENTTFTCCHELRPVDVEGASIPIGRPISNTRVVVLDGEMSPVPVGVPGELYIGGSGLARGYLDQAGLTASRFVADPFGDGERLYRTGDLVRYQRTGTLEFLGRQDHQVKVRGFRIELGEIEAALTEHSAVRESVVLVRQDDKQKRLAAYLTFHAEPHPSVTDLQGFLRDQLPAYMVPSFFEFLEGMPLDPNGKIDRRGLLALATVNESLTERIAPRNPLEAQLVEIWEEVLEVENLGVRDNFFDVGGHSLLATQLLARVYEELSVKLPVRAVFEAQTVEQLAEWIENELHSNAGAGRVLEATASTTVDAQIDKGAFVDLTPEELEQHFGSEEGIEALYPLAPFQEKLLRGTLEGSGLWMIQANFGLAGHLDISAFARAWQTVYDRHSTLRAGFRSQGFRQPIQVVREVGETIDLPVIDWGGLGEESQNMLLGRFLQDDLARQFDPATDRLLRLAVIRLADHLHRVVVTCNHLIMDGWTSNGVVLPEVFACYEAYSSGGDPQLPPAPAYQNYMSWLRDRDVEASKAYWKRNLDGVVGPMALWQDPRVTGEEKGRDSLSVAIPEEATRRLEELARRHRLTINTLTQGAWALTLSHFCGGLDEVLFDSVASGRPVELEGMAGMAGCFINSLPLRVKLPPEAQVSTWLADLQIQQLERLEFTYSRAESVKEWCGLPQDVPLCEASFVCINHPLYQDSGDEDPGELRILDFSGYEENSYALDMAVVPGQQLTMAMVYPRRIFSAEAMSELLEFYGNLLEAIVERPEQQISGLLKRVARVGERVSEKPALI